jgi:hypothetical protein
MFAGVCLEQLHDGLSCAADGFLGLRGWQWLFLLEGIPTVFLGIWVWATLAPTPLEASFLTQPEREYVHQRVKSHKVCTLQKLASRGSCSVA